MSKLLVDMLLVVEYDISDLLSVELAGGTSGGVEPLDDGSLTLNVPGTPGFGASLASFGFSAAKVIVQGMMVCDVRSLTEPASGAVGVVMSVPNRVANGSFSGSLAGDAACSWAHASMRHNTAAVGFITEFAAMTVDLYPSVTSSIRGIAGTAERSVATALTDSTALHRHIAEIGIKPDDPYTPQSLTQT